MASALSPWPSLSPFFAPRLTPLHPPGGNEGMQRSLPYQKYPRTEQAPLMQRGMNRWIVSCLMTPTSYSTAPPPQPPRHPTCPMQLVGWPALALPTSCALRHVESRARGKPRRCSAGKPAWPQMIPHHVMGRSWHTLSLDTTRCCLIHWGDKRHLKHDRIPSRVKSLS